MIGANTVLYLYKGAEALSTPPFLATCAVPGVAH
jgi:hypothetical protein